MLLSWDKCDKKAATAPSKGESYLKQTQNTAATHTGRGADTVTCCSAAQKLTLQLFKQPPLILYLSSWQLLKHMQMAPSEVQHCANNCSPVKRTGQPEKAPWIAKCCKVGCSKLSVLKALENFHYVSTFSTYTWEACPYVNWTWAVGWVQVSYISDCCALWCSLRRRGTQAWRYDFLSPSSSGGWPHSTCVSWGQNAIFKMIQVDNNQAENWTPCPVAYGCKTAFCRTALPLKSKQPQADSWHDGKVLGGRVGSSLQIRLITPVTIRTTLLWNRLILSALIA